MRLKLFLLFLLSVLPSPSSQAPDPTFAVFQLLDEDFVHNRNKIEIALQTPPKKIQKYHKNAQSSSAQQAASYDHNVIDISQRDFDLNEVDVDRRALNILDKINAQEADEFGRKCVNKTMMRRETEYEEVMTCEHSYDERCHTSYTTTYEPHQEEECEERFRKVCMISQEHKSVTEMVEECTTPLVPDCSSEAEDVCRTVYDTVCDTKQVPYEVEEQFPVCTTVNMTKCEDVTTGLLTEEKCVVWPTQQCTVETRTVSHTNSETECRKEPRELCAPGDCPLVEGPPLCQEKMKTVVVDNPVEQCDLEPSQTCKQVTKLVPQLKPTQECVQVPKEVCATSRLRPTIKNVPFIQKWCFKPSLSTSTQPATTTTSTQPPTTTTQPPSTTTQPPSTTTQPPSTTTQPPSTTTQPPATTPAWTSGKVLVQSINIATEECLNCGEEAGLTLSLRGEKNGDFPGGYPCSTSTLTSPNFLAGKVAKFDGREDACYRAPLNKEVTGGELEWKGQGEWKPSSICVDWNEESKNFAYVCLLESKPDATNLWTLQSCEVLIGFLDCDKFYEDDE